MKMQEGLLPPLHFSNQAHSCVKRLQPGAVWLRSACSCCSRLCSSLLSSKVREKQSICELQQEGARGPPRAKVLTAMVQTDACYYWVLHLGCILLIAKLHTAFCWPLHTESEYWQFFNVSMFVRYVIISECSTYCFKVHSLNELIKMHRFRDQAYSIAQ